MRAGVCPLQPEAVRGGGGWPEFVRDSGKALQCMGAALLAQPMGPSSLPVLGSALHALLCSTTTLEGQPLVAAHAHHPVPIA